MAIRIVKMEVNTSELRSDIEQDEDENIHSWNLQPNLCSSIEHRDIHVYYDGKKWRLDKVVIRFTP
jgi:hypothetical protein